MKRAAIIALLLFSTKSFSVFAQNDSIEAVRSGKALFQTYCSPCHGVHREIVGPMLASITKKRSEGWLIAFIKNSQEIITSGDAYASFLYRQYNHTVMPSFNQLSYKEIRDILRYIESESFVRTDALTRPSDDVLTAGQPDLLLGRDLFLAQCAPCHFITHEGYGPALGSITKRWPDTWLIPFIKNSQKVIRAGDPYAVQLFEAFDRKEMVPMEFLKESEIRSILHYIEFVSASPHVEAGENGRKSYTVTASAYNNHTDIGGVSNSRPFFKVLLIIIAVLGAIAHVYLTIRLFRYLNREL